ncbi:hypothetical protein Lal_00048091 [Lupinus albus]|nr:hypothetical protein Lal_00048091 [Lupinus albus]
MVTQRNHNQVPTAGTREHSIYIIPIHNKEMNKGIIPVNSDWFEIEKSRKNMGQKIRVPYMVLTISTLSLENLCACVVIVPCTMVRVILHFHIQCLLIHEQAAIQLCITFHI